MPLPTGVTTTNLVALDQTAGAITEILQKRPYTTCLSRSLKVTGTDTDRSATYDFLLVFYSNCGPISYRFRDKKRYLQIFPPLVYNASAEGVPLQIL